MTDSTKILKPISKVDMELTFYQYSRRYQNDTQYRNHGQHESFTHRADLRSLPCSVRVSCVLFAVYICGTDHSLWVHMSSEALAGIPEELTILYKDKNLS